MAGQADGVSAVEGSRLESARCRNCGASLELGRIDRTLGTVTCAHCGGLHLLATPDGKGPAPPAGAAPRPRTPATRERGLVPLPARFDVHRGDGALQVRWAKGNKVGAVLLAAFAAAWGIGAVGSGLVFLAPVSLGILYLAAVRGINRTTLRIERGGVSVRQGPLPWRGARRDVPREDIAQLFSSEHVTRTNNGSDGHRQVQEYRSYRLQAIDRAGGKRLLVGGLSSADQALWLEREAEALLGIENVAVAGELP